MWKQFIKENLVGFQTKKVDMINIYWRQQTADPNEFEQMELEGDYMIFNRIIGSKYLELITLIWDGEVFDYNTYYIPLEYIFQIDCNYPMQEILEPIPDGCFHSIQDYEHVKLMLIDQWYKQNNRNKTKEDAVKALHVSILQEESFTPEEVKSLIKNVDNWIGKDPGILKLRNLLHQYTGDETCSSFLLKFYNPNCEK